jgi:hypothetical protein
MPRTHVRCQVLEVPVHDHWVRTADDWPRDLLPWADPYIAQLIRRLEEQYDEDARFDPFLADDAPFPSLDEAWTDDAFVPEPLEAWGSADFRPVYGGFPLLDDVEADEPPL